MIIHQGVVLPAFRPAFQPGLRGLAFDGTGLLGTGLFCWPPGFLGGDGSCSWGWGEGIFAVLGIYMLWSSFRVTRVGVRRGRKAVGAAKAAFSEA